MAAFDEIDAALKRHMADTGKPAKAVHLGRGAYHAFSAGMHFEGLMPGSPERRETPPHFMGVLFVDKRDCEELAGWEIVA